jgi:3-phenylpropionate/trans-cinnamate dioxygenase ferredoxin subunit
VPTDLPLVDVDACADDLAEGELRSVTLPGDRVALLSIVAGAPAAIDDRCNHAGCLLSRGWREGDAVVCPCHEYAFDLRSGAHTSAWKLCGDQDRYEVARVGGRLRLTGPVEGGR